MTNLYRGPLYKLIDTWQIYTGGPLYKLIDTWQIYTGGPLYKLIDTWQIYTGGPLYKLTGTWKIYTGAPLYKSAVSRSAQGQMTPCPGLALKSNMSKENDFQN